MRGRAPSNEMSRQTEYNQTITQYLLGSLPDAETERLDELSLADDEFAEAIEVAEKDLVDAYVQGDLKGTALAQFKSHYMGSPLRREKVLFAQTLSSYSEKHIIAPADSAATEDATARKRASLFSFLPVFALPLPAWQWTTAFAMLALLIAGGWLVFENLRPHQQMTETRPVPDAPAPREQERPQKVEEARAPDATNSQEQARDEHERAERGLKQPEDGQRQTHNARPQSPPEKVNSVSFAAVLLPQVRGAGQIPTVSVSRKSDDVLMKLELEPNEYQAYSVTLLNASSNQIIWRSGTLTARARGENKSLSVRLRANLLQPQTYTLRVAGIPAAGRSPEIISDYPFRVVK